jgi:uncharacterized membrane protein
MRPRILGVLIFIVLVIAAASVMLARVPWAMWVLFACEIAGALTSLAYIFHVEKIEKKVMERAEVQK